MGARQHDDVDPVAVWDGERGIAAARTASMETGPPASLASASSTSSGDPWRITMQSEAKLALKLST